MYALKIDGSGTAAAAAAAAAHFENADQLLAGASHSPSLLETHTHTCGYRDRIVATRSKPSSWAFNEEKTIYILSASFYRDKWIKRYC